MVKIRQGVMRDCTELLEVYQGTRWFYRTREGGYTTVEQVKSEHRGASFERWGWLVAEVKNRVVGEIVFRSEKTPHGRIGIIRNLDVDVRSQKTTIGTRLTRAAEDIMRKKRIVRVVATTPPAAYNFWMKIGYFARGSISEIVKPIARIPEKKTRKVKTVRVSSDARRVPKSMRFSNLAYPGSLVELAGEIIDGIRKGRLLEFYSADSLVGVGAVAKGPKTTATFVADVTRKGEDHLDVVISRTALAARSLKAKKVESRIPKSSLATFSKIVKWSSQDSTDIPVTRLL
ncbi:MAG: GNAT family N-acetyltransferase [Candidatus Thorarchaeota archaeon]